LSIPPPQHRQQPLTFSQQLQRPQAAAAKQLKPTIRPLRSPPSPPNRTPAAAQPSTEAHPHCRPLETGNKGETKRNRAAKRDADLQNKREKQN